MESLCHRFKRVGFAVGLLCGSQPPPDLFRPRYTGLFTATLFYVNLQKIIKATMPLCVTNLPAGPLNNNAFTVHGLASTNATLVGSVKGVSNQPRHVAN